MAHIHDVIRPKIVPYGDFANAMNEHASYKTDTGRTLEPIEIALLEIAELKKRIAELEAREK